MLEKYASNTKAITRTTFSPSMLCMCLLVCKLNFTLPAAGCLGPPGTAECQLLIGWLLRKNSRTVCSDLSLYLADHHKQSLSHSLWVTFLAAVKFPPWKKRWHFCSHTSLCVCDSADTHSILLPYRERETSMYFSLLKSTQRDEISHWSLWNQCWVMCFPHLHANK